MARMTARGPVRPVKPTRPPRSYVPQWPTGRVQRVPEEEGGAATEFLAEQVARLAGQMLARRQERGLRRSQLAARTGLRPHTILDVEEGRSWPEFRTLGLIAWALDADLEFEPRVAMRAAEPVTRYRTD